jgi:hypothetical protein
MLASAQTAPHDGPMMMTDIIHAENTIMRVKK